MSTLHIICRIGDSEYAIQAAFVHQMESYTGATRVPGAPSYVAGLVQVRQQIIPLLDLRVRFGLPAKPPTLDSRVVVLTLDERLVGLVVDSAREVQNIAPEQFRPPPEVLTRQSTGFVRSVAQLKDRIIMLLDPGKVVGEEVVHG
ncbi:MAG: chemotaxis protein CheW [Bdellovibrionales bacterium]